MKQNLFKITLLSFALLAAPGCALLPFGNNDDVCQTDPVACAAMSQRLPQDRWEARTDESRPYKEARTDGSGPYKEAYTDESRPHNDRSPASANQLTLGMSRRDVQSLWGAPQDVQVAGDSQLGNERWRYYNGLSSRWSISQSRTVYFEEGRVVGWESGH